MKLATQKDEPTTTPRPATPEYAVPGVNICETKEGYVIEAEMPGVSKHGLEITLEGTELTLVGHRSAPPLPDSPLFREASTADFKRVFELDPAIDASKISAKMDQGILTLTLPKSEAVKPRRISVE
jgi:HSP20 family protein